MTTGAGAGGLRVLALAPYPEPAPSTRYRLAQLVAPLRERGIEMVVHPFLSGADWPAVRRRRVSPGGLLRAGRSLRTVLASVGGYDAVLVQRGASLLLDREILPSLAGRGAPLVYDFDDAVFLPQPGGSRWVELLRRPRATVEAACRAASRVLAGNDYLADFARGAVGAGGGARVRVVPTAVDTRIMTPGRRDGTGPTLGWVGSDSTLPYLEALAPALRRLARSARHRLLVVGGARRPALPGVAFDFVPWTAEAEPSLVASLDLGLYPLDDTPWSRGKCGFKALQYLACGVPCVASPVGVLRDIVRPGVTGLHADGADSWVEACASLLSDPAERRRMGEAGRALVQERYSVDAVAPLVAEALTEAASGARAGGAEARR